VRTALDWADGLVRLARIRHRLRVARLNAEAGIRIDPATHIAPSARIKLRADGWTSGGRVRIARGVVISDGAIVAPYGGSVVIESNVFVGPYCVLYGHGGLVIGRNTMLGAHTAVVPFNHGFARVDVPMNHQPLTLEGIDIGEDVWIGANCTVLDGVRIGTGVVIGAGSVVTRSIDAYAVAVGAPATVMRSRK